MISEGKATLIESCVGDPNSIIDELDDDDIKLDKEVLEGIGEFYCNEAGIQPSSIQERSYYSILHNNDGVRECIANYYKLLKDPNTWIDSKQHFVQQVANDLPHIDNDIDDGDVNNMAASLSGDDGNTEYAMLSIAAILTKNGS